MSTEWKAANRTCSYVFAIFLCAITHASAYDEANSKLWKTHVTMTGDDLKMIIAVMPELAKRRPNWGDDYEVELTETDETYIVDFWRPKDGGTVSMLYQDKKGGEWKDSPLFERHTGGLAIHLDKRTLKVVEFENEFE